MEFEFKYVYKKDDVSTEHTFAARPNTECICTVTSSTCDEVKQFTDKCNFDEETGLYEGTFILNTTNRQLLTLFSRKHMLELNDAYDGFCFANGMKSRASELMDRNRFVYDCIFGANHANVQSSFVKSYLTHEALQTLTYWEMLTLVLAALTGEELPRSEAISATIRNLECVLDDLGTR